MAKRTWSANQLVAYNLARARDLRRKTQRQAGEDLAVYLGEPWTTATWSSAERSVEGKRIRQFTPNEILAFSHMFDVPPSYFFMPPPKEVGKVTFTDPKPGTRPPKTVKTQELLELVLLVSDPIGRRIAEMDLDPEKTLRKQLWDQTVAMVAGAAPLDAEIDRLASVVEFLSKLRESVLQWAMSTYTEEIDTLTAGMAAEAIPKPTDRKKGGKSK